MFCYIPIRKHSQGQSQLLISLLLHPPNNWPTPLYCNGFQKQSHDCKCQLSSCKSEDAGLSWLGDLVLGAWSY